MQHSVLWDGDKTGICHRLDSVLEGFSNLDDSLTAIWMNLPINSKKSTKTPGPCPCSPHPGAPGCCPAPRLLSQHVAGTEPSGICFPKHPRPDAQSSHFSPAIQGAALIKQQGNDFHGERLIYVHGIQLIVRKYKSLSLEHFG